MNGEWEDEEGRGHEEWDAGAYEDHFRELNHHTTEKPE